jgi:hypothetical protein
MVEWGRRVEDFGRACSDPLSPRKGSTASAVKRSFCSHGSPRNPRRRLSPRRSTGRLWPFHKQTGLKIQKANASFCSSVDSFHHLFSFSRLGSNPLVTFLSWKSQGRSSLLTLSEHASKVLCSSSVWTASLRAVFKRFRPKRVVLGDDPVYRPFRERGMLCYFGNRPRIDNGIVDHKPLLYPKEPSGHLQPHLYFVR